ncbi:MAG: restriction endonuclease [Proteiniphilum sp.]|nr:restriction endonuclease [Proteiniphilum sp.]
MKIFITAIILVAIIQSNPTLLVIIGFVAISIYIIRLFINKARTRKIVLSYQHLEELINGFDPYEFEEYIAQIFKMSGYNTQLTSKSNDGGYDIIVSSGKSVSLVEVKKYSLGNKIGREKIQKLHSAVIDYGARTGIFVTTSSFTNAAIEYANRNKIELIDGSTLISKIRSLNG